MSLPDEEVFVPKGAELHETALRWNAFRRETRRFRACARHRQKPAASHWTLLIGMLFLITAQLTNVPIIWLPGGQKRSVLS